MLKSNPVFPVSKLHDLVKSAMTQRKGLFPTDLKMSNEPEVSALGSLEIRVSLDI